MEEGVTCDMEPEGQGEGGSEVTRIGNRKPTEL